MRKLSSDPTLLGSVPHPSAQPTIPHGAASAVSGVVLAFALLSPCEINGHTVAAFHWRGTVNAVRHGLATVSGQTGGTNSWTKPTSGYWEEPFWSLGVLPDATQSVLFTNAGWKALAIGSGTAQNFPQSMQVQSLRAGAPVDSYNTLLMNFSGFERPLQTGSLTVDPNGAVTLMFGAPCLK